MNDTQNEQGQMENEAKKRFAEVLSEMFPTLEERQKVAKLFIVLHNEISDKQTIFAKSIIHSQHLGWDMLSQRGMMSAFDYVRKDMFLPIIEILDPSLAKKEDV